MRIMLFDMWAGGHNARYFDRFADALAGNEIIVVAPAEVCHQVTAGTVTVIQLPAARSAPVFGRPEDSWEDSITHEIDLITALVGRYQPDLFIHLFADHLAGRAAEIAQIVDTALVVLFPTAHYEPAFGSRLTAAEAQRGAALAAAVQRFRVAPGARCVFMLDAVAAQQFDADAGAPVVWLPEPWVGTAGGLPGQRKDTLVFFGAIAHRKGFDLLASALMHEPPQMTVVVAGWIEQQGYEEELMPRLAGLRNAGVRVDLRLQRLDEEQTMGLMRAAGVVVLPYRRHFGMSRVLLEAVHTRTPVVVNDFGLLAHTVNAAGLGVSTDAFDPASLSAAITSARNLCGDASFTARCETFTAQFSRAHFVQRLHGGLRQMAYPIEEDIQ